MPNPFSTMAQTMPGQNDLVAKGLNEARKTSFQQSIAAAPKTKAAPVAQQLGVQQAQAQGAQTLATQATNIGEQAKVGQQFMQAEAEGAKQALRQAALTNRKKNFEETERLSNLDSRLKQELFDSNLKFKEDELGRTLFNEQQLLDYRISNAKSDEELMNYEQEVRQQSERRLQMLQTAHAKLKEELQQGHLKGEQELDQAHRKEILLAEKAIRDKIAKEQRKARNRAAMFSAAGSIVGAVGGAILGAPAGPVGIAAGASAGSSLGSGLGTLASTSKV